MTKIGVALLFLAANFYIYHFLATEEVIPDRTNFSAFPMEISDFRCPGSETMPDDVIENLGATDYIICSYSRAESDDVVSIYVGYHETQVRKEGGGAKENAIHPPEHCLPGSGWDVIDSQIVELDIEGLPTATGRKPEAKRFIIAKGNDRQLVYFWYQSRGRIIARNYEVILYRFWDRAVRNRTDGSLVRFTVNIPRGDEEGAERLFQEFAGQIVPLLRGYVPI